MTHFIIECDLTAQVGIRVRVDVWPVNNWGQVLNFGCLQADVGEAVTGKLIKEIINLHPSSLNLSTYLTVKSDVRYRFL